MVEMKQKSNVEVGVYVVVVMFFLGIAVQAGIQIGKTDNLEKSTLNNREAIGQLTAQMQASNDRANSTAMVTEERMTRMEQMLLDIRDSLKQPQQETKK